MYGIDVGALYWGIGIFVFFVIVWIIMAKSLLKSEPVEIKVNLADRYDDISEEQLNDFGIDANEFKNMVYEKFQNIHNALTNEDYEILKINLTNDLYQYYIEQLEILKTIKHKNIMKDIELVNIKIYKVTKKYDLLLVELYLNVRMLDYVIDVDTGKCISGNDIEKIDFEFELCFEKRRKGSQYVMSKKLCINDMVVKVGKKNNT